MSKLMTFFLVFFLAATLISAAARDKCGRHGDPCVSISDCCAHPNMACHRYAHRCQIQITKDELMAQREKILGRKGPDYRK